MFNAVGGGLRPVVSDYVKTICLTLNELTTMVDVKIAPDAPIIDNFGDDLEGQAIVLKATKVED